MKRFMIVFMLAFAALLVLSVYPVFATSHTVGVSVTVEAKNIAISVDENAYNYGPLALSETTETTTTFNVKNEGNVNMDLYVMGSHTTEPNSNVEKWHLADGNNYTYENLNVYKHEWKAPAGLNQYADMTLGNSIVGAVAPLDIKGLKFQISMPASVDSFLQQNAQVTFTALEGL